MSDTDTGKALMILGILFFLIPFFVIPIFMATGNIFSLTPAIFVFSALGMLFLIIGGILSGGSNVFGFRHSQQRIPPVQYPRNAHVQRDRDPVTEITCPNCGASPKYIDTYGLCMCDFCHTKFKVR